MTAEQCASGVSQVSQEPASGPLSGLRVVELGGIGPGPHAAMLLADLGANVVRVERDVASGIGGYRDVRANVMHRSRQSVILDVKHPAGREAVLQLLDQADVLIEGFRPGVLERLGLDPEQLLQRNPGLIIGRITGWGQDGPLAARAGHDINYIGLTGVLNSIGRADGPPQVPVNLVGDFGGGSMYLLVGILSALHERQRSGLGQVIDAAIVDGVVSLASMLWGQLADGAMSQARGTNLLDTGRPFYDVYQTQDGRWLSVGALEPKFYAKLVQGLGLEREFGEHQDSADRWPEMRAAFARVIGQRTRDEWEQVFDGIDGCVGPILSWTEVADHPQMAHRGNLIEVDGVSQPAPMPRFSRSKPGTPTLAKYPGSDTRATLIAWGVKDVDQLLESGAATQTDSPPQ